MVITDQRLLIAQSALGASSTVNLRQGGADAIDAATNNCTFSDNAVQGTVVAEGADDVSYAGQWELIATFTLVAGNTNRFQTAQQTKFYRAIRHRITDAIQGGTVTTRYKSSGDI